MRIVCFIAACLVLLCDLHTAGESCMMLPKDFAGGISQNSHKAIVYHRDGKEDLILKIGYQLKGEKVPDNFAWIVTVPNEPEKYNVGTEELFEQTQRWAVRNVANFKGKDSKLSKRSRSLVDSQKKYDGLEFGKRAEVGPYDIQPVRARGLEALNVLNEWLSANGFPTEDPDHMKYFVENKFTFLAIKISPEKDSKLSMSGELPPLHLSFQTEKIYYPLKFSSRQGVFDLQLYTLTEEKLDYSKSSSELKKLSWYDNGYKRNVVVNTPQFPTELTKALEKSAFELNANKMYLNVLNCKEINKGESIATWNKDIFLASTKNSRIESSFPIMIPFGLIAAGLLIAGVLFFTRKRNGTVNSPSIQIVL